MAETAVPRPGACIYPMNACIPCRSSIWPLVYSPRRTAKNTRMIFQRATRHPLRSLFHIPIGLRRCGLLIPATRPLVFLLPAFMQISVPE